MKKNYQAPKLLVECFSLTQHLASCGISINSTGISCVISSPAATNEMRDLAIQGYFADSCPRAPIAGPGEYDSFCYVTASGLAFGS